MAAVPPFGCESRSYALYLFQWIRHRVELAAPHRKGGPSTNERRLEAIKRRKVVASIEKPGRSSSQGPSGLPQGVDVIAINPVDRK